jgi:hypothetical protein
MAMDGRERPSQARCAYDAGWILRASGELGSDVDPKPFQRGEAVETSSTSCARSRVSVSLQCPRRTGLGRAFSPQRIGESGRLRGQ